MDYDSFCTNSNASSLLYNPNLARGIEQIEVKNTSSKNIIAFKKSPKKRRYPKVKKVPEIDEERDFGNARIHYELLKPKSIHPKVKI